MVCLELLLVNISSTIYISNQKDLMNVVLSPLLVS